MQSASREKIVFMNDIMNNLVVRGQKQEIKNDPNVN